MLQAQQWWPLCGHRWGTNECAHTSESKVSAAVSEHQPDGAAGVCREVLEEFWCLFPEGPHRAMQASPGPTAVAFLKVQQTQTHVDSGIPQQLVPDKNTTAQKTTTFTPWFSNKDVFYASFTPPHCCSNMKNVALLLSICGCFSTRMAKAGTQQRVCTNNNN